MKRQVFLALMVMAIALPLFAAQGRWEDFNKEDVEAFITSTMPKTAGSDMIHVCADKKTGAMRLVDDPTQCLQTERRLKLSTGGQQCPAAPVEDGPVRIHDANGQFLGIYSGSVPDGGCLYSGILVPSLGLFLCINNSTISGQGVAYPVIDWFNINSENELLVSGKTRVFHSCDGKYYVGTGEPWCGEVVGRYLTECRYSLDPQPKTNCLYMVEEFDISLLPFTLPVALPLRYE